MVRNRFEYSLFMLVGLIVCLAILIVGVVLVCLGEKAGGTEINLVLLRMTTRSVGVVAICVAPLLVVLLLWPLRGAFASNVKEIPSTSTSTSTPNVQEPPASAKEPPAAAQAPAAPIAQGPAVAIGPASCSNLRRREYRTYVSVAGAEALELRLSIRALIREIRQENKPADPGVCEVYANKLVLLAETAANLADAHWLANAGANHGGLIGSFTKAFHELQKQLAKCRGEFQNMQKTAANLGGNEVASRYDAVVNQLEGVDVGLEDLCQEGINVTTDEKKEYLGLRWQKSGLEPAMCGRVM